MKTTFKFIIAAMAAVSVFSSCQKELANETVNNTTGGVRTIAVQFDNSTKATLDGFTPKFANGDAIRVSNTEKSEECTVSVDGSGNATFTTTLSGALTAIYPAAAAVYTSGTPDGPISSPYFKVSASQDGTMEKAIIAKATVAEGESTATFYGLTSLFVVTPPSGATSFTITSLNKIGTDGQRSGTATSINTDGADDAKKCVITVEVPTGGTAYVSLVPGVNLTDLSFDAGANYGMKGIPMKDIKTAGKTNATAANTKYTIGNANNTWHPYVVIDGKKWATMNIGASSATDAGIYFSWGAVEKVYSALSSNTFTFLTDNPDSERYTGTWSDSDGFDDCNTPYYVRGSGYLSSKYKDNSSATLQLSDDAANANWGGSWRMPTKEEFDALTSVGGSAWDGTGTVKGYRFGTSPNQIFLPAAGFGDRADLKVGDYGYCWSSSLYTDRNCAFAYNLGFYDGESITDYSYRFYGQSVRALSE